MRILITGATGFIGSHLAELLVDKGYQVRALVRSTSNTRFVSHLPIEYVEGNITVVDTLRAAVEGVDMIYHVAGLTAARSREEYFRGNAEATSHLLEAAARYAPDLRRFVHLSSQTAVGPASSPEHPADESWPFAPITVYGQSKAESERVVHRMMGTIPATIVRAPAVYGERDPEILRFFKMVSVGVAPMIGFDRKLVSLVHVGDLVRGYVLAGEHPRAVGETYFISSEEFYAWDEVGRVTARVMGRRFVVNVRVPHAIAYAAAGVSGFVGRFQQKPPVFNFEKGRDITRKYWICSVDKAVRDLGYEQQVPIEEGVARTVAWYRHHKWL